jgi:hypothetical protein
MYETRDEALAAIRKSNARYERLDRVLRDAYEQIRCGLGAAGVDADHATRTATDAYHAAWAALRRQGDHP